MKAPLLAAAVMVISCVQADAQMDVGAAAVPDDFGFYGEERQKSSLVPVTPLALATSLAFDVTTWNRLQVSTAPARDLSRLFDKGFYKLELFQVILMAKQSGSALNGLAAEREKGKSLRDMAQGLKIDYDKVYDESLSLSREIEDRWLPSILTVEVSTSPSSAPLRKRTPGPRFRKSHP